MRELSLKGPEVRRAQSEESYHKAHKMDFLLPLRVEAPKDQSTDLSSYRVFVRRPDYQYSKRTLSTLSPDECKASCCKDIAIYLNPPATGKLRNGSKFFDSVYRRFFPHRDPDLDISGGHFFAQVIDFKSQSGGGTLSEVTLFHDAFCQKVGSEVSSLVQSDPRLPAGFGLTSTFKNALLIIEDVRSEDPSVLVVCVDEETAERLRLGKEERELDPNAGSAGNPDPGNAWPFRYRVNLTRLMDAIFRLNERRRVGAEPDSLFWTRDILKQEEDIKYVR